MVNLTSLSLNVVHKDHQLTQPQLDAIVPVLNKFAIGARMSKKKFEEACEQAMADAGCPFDTTRQLDMTACSLLNDLPPLSAKFRLVLEDPLETLGRETNNGHLSLYVEDQGQRHCTFLAYTSRESFEKMRTALTEYLNKRASTARPRATPIERQ